VHPNGSSFTDKVSKLWGQVHTVFVHHTL
jgi:hypothetical protein